jgi:PAS domain S-box-containing protein
MNKQKEQSKLRRFWNRLVAPPAFIQDDLEKRGTRLVNALLVGFSLLGFAVEVLSIVFYSFTGEISGYTGYRITFVVIAVIGLVYLLNRTRYHRWALSLLQVVITAAIFVAAFSFYEQAYGILFYLVIPLALTTIYPSVRKTFVLAALLTAITPLATVLLDPASLEVVMLDVVPALAIFSALLVLLNQYRSSYEADRRREVEERERLFRSIFEQSVDAIFLVNPDGSGMHANTRAQELLGYTAEELGKLRPADLAVPYERDDSRNKLEWVVETGLLAVYERTMLTKDGREVPTEMHVSAIKDAEGNIVLVQTVARDIRERKERQAQVERLTMGVN